MSLADFVLARLGRCAFCAASLGGHHLITCSRYAGQVLPSECPGYLEEVRAQLSTTPRKEPGHG